MDTFLFHRNCTSRNHGTAGNREADGFVNSAVSRFLRGEGTQNFWPKTRVSKAPQKGLVSSIIFLNRELKRKLISDLWLRSSVSFRRNGKMMFHQGRVRKFTWTDIGMITFGRKTEPYSIVWVSLRVPLLLERVRVHLYWGGWGVIYIGEGEGSFILEWVRVGLYWGGRGFVCIADSVPTDQGHQGKFWRLFTFRGIRE